MSTDTFVAGVGMVRFRRPQEGTGYIELATAAVKAALTDAMIELANLDHIVAGFVYGDTASGQTVIYHLGMPGVPIINVNNACASGSTAVYLARQAILSGEADCALAFGFEQMISGPLPDPVFEDRADPCKPWLESIEKCIGETETVWPAYYSVLARELIEKEGVHPKTFAKIVVKARSHASQNPNAVYRDLTTIEEVLTSPTVIAPITKAQCSRPTSGAAAVILCSKNFAARHGLSRKVRLRAQAMVSDLNLGLSKDCSVKETIGYSQYQRAAQLVYEGAGIGPDELNVVELHDCFAPAELLLYEALNLTPEGTAEAFVSENLNTYGGRVVVNPSGGLLGKGHPLGATGVAQIVELTWHLRGDAGSRQVSEASIGLAHNSGTPSGCVVSLLSAA